MKRSFLVSVLIVIISTAVAQTIPYSGAVKNVSFKYYSNWQISHEQGAVFVHLPKGGDTFFSIASGPREKSPEATLAEMRKQLPGAHKTMFNGYEAYGDEGQYFLFRGNTMYIVMTNNESKDKNIAEQLKNMIATVRFK